MINCSVYTLKHWSCDLYHRKYLCCKIETQLNTCAYNFQRKSFAYFIEYLSIGSGLFLTYGPIVLVISYTNVCLSQTSMRTHNCLLVCAHGNVESISYSARLMMLVYHTCNSQKLN